MKYPHIIATGLSITIGLAFIGGTLNATSEFYGLIGIGMITFGIMAIVYLFKQ